MNVSAENEKVKTNIFNKSVGFIRRRPFFVSLCAFFIVSLIIYIVSRSSEAFAEFWARYPSAGIRYFTATLTSLLPFSLAETIILLIPLAIISVIWTSISSIRKNSGKSFTKLLMSLVSVLMIICILFCLGFGPCYFRATLAENLSLSDEPVSGESLYDTAVWLTEDIDALLQDINFSSTGESHMPYSFDELSEIVNNAFNDFTEDEDFISSFNCPVKTIALSDPMTYTHISGVYSFFTGEANVNVNYPDFIMPYTVAHEMSHQRGIAREDEANFTAFLVCMRSNDPYVKYSGCFNVLREVLSALYKSDKDLYKQYRSEYYPSELAGEISAYSIFFDKYRESTAAKVVSGTNNTYLSSQNVKSGVKSYGLVTDLAVAYYETIIRNNQT